MKTFKKFAKFVMILYNTILLIVGLTTLITPSEYIEDFLFKLPVVIYSLLGLYSVLCKKVFPVVMYATLTVFIAIDFLLWEDI